MPTTARPSGLTRAGLLGRAGRSAVPSDLHLMRRATHGPAPADWLAVQALGGVQPWLTTQLLDVPDAACDAQVAARFPMAVVTPAAAKNTEVTFTDAVHRQTAAAHLYRQLFSTRQLYEQVVDVFFNHLNVPFTTDVARWTYGSYYRDVIRAHAYGRFADMVAAMVRHGAMLEYLDAAWSSKKKPNENLGRELLELHTVGVGAGYTQRDVRSAALALTGLSVDGEAHEYLYRPELHHTGEIRVMGFRAANRDPNGEQVVLDLVAYLTRHPACARRVARKLAVRFVSDSPSPRLVSDLAAVYLAEDTAIAPVLAALFAHPETRKAVGAKTRRPSQQAIAFARTCGILPVGTSDAGSFALLYHLVGYGDALLNQPSPDGLPDTAEAWSSTASRLAALDSARRTLIGWGDGLSTPGAPELRPGLPHETGAEPWLPVSQVTAEQVVDALARRHLGTTLSPAQTRAVATAAGWSVSAPPAPLVQYDAGLAVAVALLAGHPRHLVR